MKITETEFEGLLIIQPAVHGDQRGYFYESWQNKRFSDVDIKNDFVQDNEARSNYGVIRGLHYQLPPMAQAKLVRVIIGEILDVVVDIRPSSKTFGQSYQIILSETNKIQLLVPRGFAHGYACLSEDVIFAYKCDNYYSKEHEGHIRFDDSSLKIDWKIPKNDQIVSEKDMIAPNFGNHIAFEHA